MQRTNTESIFESNIKIYRDEKKDIYLRCICGYNEIIQKNVEVVEDELSKTLRKAIADHVCAQSKAA